MERSHSLINNKVPVCSEAVIWRCSVKKVFLNISQKPQESACVEVSFWANKVASLRPATLLTPIQVFSREFFGIVKDTFVTEYLLVPASVIHRLRQYYF